MHYRIHLHSKNLLSNTIWKYTPIIKYLTYTRQQFNKRNQRWDEYFNFTGILYTSKFHQCRCTNLFRKILGIHPLVCLCNNFYFTRRALLSEWCEHFEFGYRNFYYSLFVLSTPRTFLNG